MASEIYRLIPEVIAVSLGFALRHFLAPIVSGKETANLLRYLKNHEETKEQKAELKCNLAETRLWLEVHADTCPYTKHAISSAKNQALKLFNEASHAKTK